jgi:intein/homing endonuclease
MKGLSLNAMEGIENLINSQFDSLSVEFLGLIPKLTKEKKLIFTTNKNSLAAMFLKALGTKQPNKTEAETMKVMFKIANGYVDALKSKTSSKVLNSIDAYIKDQNKKELPIDTEYVKGIMSKELAEAKKHFELIANSTANTNWNTATALQIAKIAEERGIEDPNIVFLVTKDDKTGFFEWILHLLPDGKTPRVWKLSEVISGYYSPGGQYPSLNGLHPECFSKNNRLYTSDGLIPLKDLIDKKDQIEVIVDGRIKNRMTGNNQFGTPISGEIWLDRHSHNKERHLIATSVFYTGKQSIYQIKMESGYEIEVSPKHEFIVDKFNNTQYKVTADNLKAGDILPVFSYGECFGNLNFPELAELMGNLLGDGKYNPNGQSVWYFFGNDMEYGQMLLDKSQLFTDKHGYSVKLKKLRIEGPDKKYNVIHSQFSSIILSRIFNEEFGLSKKPRRVPEKLFQANKETVSAFLRGLYAADGHSEAGSIVLAQNDYTFLQQIQLLLNMFGFVSQIYKHGDACVKNITYANGDVFVTNRKECWRLSLGGYKQIDRFLTEIGLGVPHKQEVALKYFSEMTYNKSRSPHRSDKIKEINILPEQDTYCLTEPMTNIVTVNGMVLGQCRCRLSMLPLNFGFDESGHITYKGKGHDEYKAQREKFGLPDVPAKRTKKNGKWVLPK